MDTNPQHSSDTNRPPDPPKPTPRRRAIRWAEHLLAAGSLVTLVLVFTPLTTMLYDSLGGDDPLEQAKYIICLGGDHARVIEAARLLRDGVGDMMIVSNHEPHAAQMRDLAIDWGADPNRVILDNGARTTRDHPHSILAGVGLNPAEDRCIIVTNFTHIARARACFKKAGYQRLTMIEPRWEKLQRPDNRNWKWRFRVLPDVIYEWAAWFEYRLRGVV